jgi:amidase
MARHRFLPVRFCNTLGTHPPELHVADGDTIETRTVDASGRDARGEKVTEGPNPQTGPFHVDGAEPGDTLVVFLDHLAPNRSTGWSSQALAPNVVDPEAVTALPRAPEGTMLRAEWALDTAAGTATLTAPHTQRLRLTLPLEPMLGCFGVAPAGGQAISTATAGPHGGNMDYRGFVGGTTVFFPVSVPGALLFVGDGHAVQGDGEICGTGIETSFDVRLTVHLRKGGSPGWPRGENALHIFTVGNARPLDQAVQHATTEMLRWLQADWGLDTLEANLLLGQCVRYDLGNMFDPAYTMVCRLPKAVLPPRVSG